MKTYKGNITELKDHEVFVFGANEQGFHGAGSAGFATFGEFGNVWRKYGYDKFPDGKKGKWNVKGKTGPQVGTEGKSYGLPTVTKCGAKKSLEPDFKPLFECCKRNPQWKFYFAQDNKTGLNGWSGKEMVDFMKKSGNVPENFILSESLSKLFEGDDCPQCDNSGRLMPDGDQCQWCYQEPNSKFNKHKQ